MSKLDDLVDEYVGVLRQNISTTEQRVTAKQAIKELMLEVYQEQRDKTRDEHELDSLMEEAINSL